jgi:hypothetical protein
MKVALNPMIWWGRWDLIVIDGGASFQSPHFGGGSFLGKSPRAATLSVGLVDLIS